MGCIQQLRRREDHAGMELSLWLPDADVVDAVLLLKDCTRTQTKGRAVLASEQGRS